MTGVRDGADQNVGHGTRGSTSNTFRTRSALLIGVVEEILARELPFVQRGFTPATADELVDGLASLLEVITGPGRVATTARLVLFLEGSHDAQLREALSGGHHLLIALSTPPLERLGALDPDAAARTLAAVMEGLIVHRIARHDTADARPVLATAVRGALARS
ncbi:TetR/AcrR family transcriptional regulator [Ornithinimicrobium sp. Y1847]|uniref:TetR/AcrR family transcriptional regulator n=1 Tax=unclassified Ornithinimicrobium TaxID=2615080 RepID=UPI003B686173